MAATFTSYPVLQEFVPSTSTNTSVRYEPPTTKLAIQRDKRYHVFLSFRGPDVRMTLLDHLFEALSTARVKVFLDTEHLVKGEKFELAIGRAMKSSAICIPIFSKGYADSAWCLAEAAAMLKTPALIIPLYYDVVPTHVRNPLHVSSPYKNSFERYYNRYQTAVVDDWKNALEEICSRLGWSKDFTEGSDARLIKTVVHDVIKALDQMTNPGTMQFPIQRSVSPQQCPENWSQGKVLGKGSFGIVYEGLNRDDGSHFAVKISDVESLESAAFEVRQEIDILQKLNHPNIVRYLGSSVQEGRLCIFLELVTMGSLRHVLDKYKLPFEENTIRMYSRQILWGLEYLHQQKIIHRDLKCANILLHPTGQVKLADFGLSKQMSESLATSCKGTPLYMAPEIITSSKEERKYGQAVDIWSLGCTIIEMASGKPPWSDLEALIFLEC